MFLRFFDSPFIYHKNEKSKPQKKDLPLLKNDITKILRSQKPIIYSRNLQSGFVTGSLEMYVSFTVIQNY